MTEEEKILIDYFKRELDIQNNPDMIKVKRNELIRLLISYNLYRKYYDTVSKMYENWSYSKDLNKNKTTFSICNRKSIVNMINFLKTQ